MSIAEKEAMSKRVKEKSSEYSEERIEIYSKAREEGEKQFKLTTRLAPEM
jgi:hypothetical protein